MYTTTEIQESVKDEVYLWTIKDLLVNIHTVWIYSVEDLLVSIHTIWIHSVEDLSEWVLLIKIQYSLTTHESFNRFIDW